MNINEMPIYWDKTKPKEMELTYGEQQKVTFFASCEADLTKQWVKFCIDNAIDFDSITEVKQTALSSLLDLLNLGFSKRDIVEAMVKQGVDPTDENIVNLLGNDSFARQINEKYCSYVSEALENKIKTIWGRKEK